MVNIQDLIDDAKCYETVRDDALARRRDLPPLLVGLGHQERPG